MNKHFEILQKTREHLITFTKDLTPEQLNKIPAGFNNNIAWNLGHILVSQQGLCYTRAGLPPAAGEEYVSTYKPGTKPESLIDSDEVNKIFQLLLSSIDQLKTDYQENLFVSYGTFTNRYGIEVANIDEAIAYVIFHEGLHLGCIASLKKLVQ